MTASLVIVGNGYAGVWAAIHATEHARELGCDVDVTLVGRDDHLTARPRLYEADLDGTRTPLAPVLEPRGVRLVVDEVAAIATGERVVHLDEQGPLAFDALVLAAGSALAGGVPVAAGARVHDVDTYAAALAMRTHVTAEAGPVVVVGAGLAGIEVACELAATHTVHLVETRDLSHLGGARAHVEAVLDDLGVAVRTGCGVARVEPGAVVLDDGTALHAATVVVTNGLRASALAGQVSDRLDSLGRVHVDATLRVEPHEAVFVAGDVAAVEIRPGQAAPMSCQCAIPMGTAAGRNAVRALAGLGPEPYVQERYVTCFDLGAAGAVLTVGFERTIHLDGAAAKDVKRRINRELILPPRAGEGAVS